MLEVRQFALASSCRDIVFCELDLAGRLIHSTITAPSGVSLKTQELYLMVFIMRYLDLFTTFYSLYTCTMKVVYLVTTATTICLIKYTEPIKSLYNADQDSFQHYKFAILPSFVIAFVTHLCGSGWHSFELVEFLWTCSFYLESVAILPQLYVLRKNRLVENLTGKFIFFLGLYRALYIPNWIYRAHTERFYRHHYVVYMCGVIQTLLYADFFYQYLKISSRICGRQRASDGEDDGVNVDDDDDDSRLIFELYSPLNSTVPLMSGLDVEGSESILQDDTEQGSSLRNDPTNIVV